MKHFGDITKIDGGKVPAVDVITFGAPCQDLSVAGLRHGMRHEALGDEETTRSGLFYEAVRIIKEMRDHDRSTGRAAELVRPRFAIYENVPGALSSNGGKDWQAVIQSLLQVVREVPDIPVPERGWPSVGSFCGVGDDGVPFSLAYKLHDAQYWGVPQRRKRLSIVVDYAGFDAPWILFDPQFERTSENGEPHAAVRDSGAKSESGEVRSECEGLPGDTEPGGAPGQGTAAVTEGGADNAESIPFGETGHGYWQRGFQTVRANPSHSSDLIVEPTVFSLQGGGATSQNSQGSGVGQDVSFTLNTMDVHGVLAVDVYNQTIDGDITGTVTAAAGGTNTSGPKVFSRGAMSFQERAGKPGGGVGDPIVYNGENITSPQNKANPKPGDPCHTLSTDTRNYVVEPTMIEMTSTKNTIIQDGTSCTLTARMGTGGNQVNAVCCDVGFFESHNDQAGTLLARQYKDPPIVTETYQEQTGALCASGYNKNGTQEAQNGMSVTGSVVRRLTPDECASLQGFPRWWCNIGEWTDSKGKLHKDADSPKYKAYGNSIAVGYDNDQSGFWCWLARRICAQYERRVTMASLFDGIGGFPLAFGAAGAIPVWASEIEEFPIAVTKIRFPEVEE